MVAYLFNSFSTPYGLFNTEIWFNMFDCNQNYIFSIPLHLKKLHVLKKLFAHYINYSIKYK